MRVPTARRVQNQLTEVVVVPRWSSDSTQPVSIQVYSLCDTSGIDRSETIINLSQTPAALRSLALTELMFCWYGGIISNCNKYLNYSI